MLVYLIKKYKILIDTETDLIMRYGFLYEP
jgi:hypothetical protein